jgi:hypothetical protein
VNFLHPGWRSARWLLLLIVGLSGLACSGRAALYPVQGKVLYKSQPLSGATVTLHPATGGDTLADWPVGQTQQDGTFTLATGGQNGAAVGEYKVTIVCLQAPQTKSSKAGGLSTASEDPEDHLKGAYADPAKSKLRVAIKDGINHLESFVLP